MAEGKVWIRPVPGNVDAAMAAHLGSTKAALELLLGAGPQGAGRLDRAVTLRDLVTLGLVEEQEAAAL